MKKLILFYLPDCNVSKLFEETEKEKADKETEKDVGEDSSSSAFAVAVAQFTQGTTITVNVGGSATGKIGGGAAPY